MVKLRGIVFAFCLSMPFAAQATDDLMPATASACEKISSSESLSSARLRAADKAAFQAIAELSAVSSFRSRVEPQVFNTKIYELADNYLTDYSLDTLSHSDNEICVEVKAGISLAQVQKSFATETTQEIAVQPLNSDESSINLPPKPDIIINRDIAYQDSDTLANAYAAPQEQMPASAPMTTILVERTEFFDGTSTDKFFNYLHDDLAKIKGLTPTESSANPDYILQPKVLKAKVDTLNDQTNRLHIVVSLTLTDTKTKQSQTEHQSRFILFESKDNAQSTAAGLIRKLFSAAVAKLTPAIKTIADSNSEVITPNS